MIIVVAIGWIMLLGGAIISVAAGCELAWRRFGWTAVIVTACVMALVWMVVFLEPAFEGFHLGCSVLSGDVRCWSHWGLLWGRGH